MLRILHDTKFDFISHWKTAAIGTIAFIVLGFILLGVHAARHNGQALNQSVEFTGGTVVQLTFQNPPSADDVRSAVDQAGFSGSEVTTFGDSRNYLVKVQTLQGPGASNADSVGAHIVQLLEKRVPGNTVTVAR